MDDDNFNQVRRDSEPHRGPLLKLLAVLGLVLGLISICLFPFGLFALLLGGVVRAMAVRDLKRMDEDLMDPRGLKETKTARDWGTIALISGLAGLILGIANLAYYILGQKWL